MTIKKNLLAAHEVHEDQESPGEKNNNTGTFNFKILQQCLYGR